MFSPYYALARRRGPASPLDHCALNVALYGPGANRWAMTERGAGTVARDATTLAIGPSALTWDGTALTIAIDEVGVPWPSRLRGRVRVTPGAVTTREFGLDAGGRHRWWPIAPCAHVEASFSAPALSWSGPGYLDTNGGDRPLERDFARWTWSRASLRESAAILYDVVRTDGDAHGLTLRCARDGGIDEEAPPLSARDLPATRWWRMPRPTRAQREARVVTTLEDAPFYARSHLATTLFGEAVPAVHESLSLMRFARPAVQAMLPFRMPRRRGPARVSPA